MKDTFYLEHGKKRIMEFLFGKKNEEISFGRKETCKHKEIKVSTT